VTGGWPEDCVLHRRPPASGDAATMRTRCGVPGTWEPDGSRHAVNAANEKDSCGATDFGGVSLLWRTTSAVAIWWRVRCSSCALAGRVDIAAAGPGYASGSGVPAGDEHPGVVLAAGVGVALIEGAPLSLQRGDAPPAIPDAAIAGIRQTMDLMTAPYLARRGKRLYCDESLGAAAYAGLLLRIYLGARFICLFRHPMHRISSGLEACPWGVRYEDLVADPDRVATGIDLAPPPLFQR
jgi:hypothetical protein